MPCSKQKKLPMPNGHIDVISYGITFPCHAERLELIKQADVVFASHSLMAICPIPLRDARIIKTNAREDAKTVLKLCREGKHVVVLASGDALYHGFGSTLAALHNDGESIMYHPDITAFQALFHRLGLAWHDARLFSVHSGKSLPVRNIAEAPFSVSYAGTTYPAHVIAQALLTFHPDSANRPALIAERLGTDEERIQIGSLAELADQTYAPTSILLVLPETSRDYLKNIAKTLQNNTTDANQLSISLPASTFVSAPILPLGLPEEYYEHENNLITASDVRAVILSRLHLPAWGTLWDIGAGSGSVGLEAAGLCPNLQVIGIEQDTKRAENIEHNRKRMGVCNYTLYIQDALSLIQNNTPDTTFGNISGNTTGHLATSSLPAPDRIFIGGGGQKLPEILTACMEQLQPNGIIVAAAVTLESFHALSLWSPEKRTAICSINIAHEQSIAGKHHHLKALNTIYVFTFRKESTQ